MSNEVAQPTEQDLSRSTAIEGAKGNKPPALDTSNFTDIPQPPTSSTQATAQNTATTEESDKTAVSGSQNEKDFLKVSEEYSDGTQKAGRGLLHVPSRSSSQKIQPSPTSTGLSGVTASDPRESIGDRSKESKGSILGRRRNGSANSSKMSITPPAQPTGPAESTNPIASKPSTKPKKKSMFSILCCGTPDSANAVDQHEATTPATKVTKIGTDRPTTASRPDVVGSKSQNNGAAPPQSEKDALKQTDSSHDREDVTSLDSGRSLQSGASAQPGANGDLTRPGVRDQPLPELPKEAGSSIPQPGQSNPAVVVQAPSRTDPLAAQSSSQNEKDAEGDAQVDDSDPLPEEKEAASNAVPRREDSVRTALPPPPPVPQPGPSDESIGPESVDGKQQWLLPPIAPRFKGKKCLVLDLDETLVHSSFKILHQADFTIPVEIEGQYHNVYVIKRPGVDQFMKRVGELYEVVVFTASVSKYGDPLLDQLDIHHVVHHRLFRESCYNHQGNYVKDLSQVGRDLRETIIIDNSPTSYIFHPQHAVPISSWFSDAHDNELLDLIPVLEDLAGSQVRDVSLVLDVAL